VRLKKDPHCAVCGAGAAAQRTATEACAGDR